MSDLDTLGGRLPSMTWLFWIVEIVIILIIGVMICVQYQESHTVYEMPNGIICDIKVMHGGRLFSATSTFEFKRCDDGEIYVNPESFLEIKK